MKEKLEEQLLAFITRVVQNETATNAEIEALPLVAAVLLKSLIGC